MKVPSFNEFISEAVETPKLVIITDEPEQAKTFHTADRLQQEAKKLGWKYYLYKLTGGYTSNEDNIRRLHNKDDEKGDLADILNVLDNDRSTAWSDFVTSFMDAILTVNSRVRDEDQLRFALFFFEHPGARVSYRDVMRLCLR